MLNDIRADRLKNIEPYVLGVVKKQLIALRKQGKDVIDFGMGNPDGATPRHIVDKLIEAAQNPKNHRYSASRGIYKLNLALCDWYKKRFGVTIDPNTEAITTIGAKEGISHLMYATINPGDNVIVPMPCYPIHAVSVQLAGGNVIPVSLLKPGDLFENIVEVYNKTSPKVKMMILSFPHNPTTRVIDIDFFRKIVDFALKNNVIIIHDIAYAEIYFDDYLPPSILQIDGAKEICAEVYSLSKTFNMPGWRVGFLAGNRVIISALEQIKSYLDYGMFQPIQIAAIHALTSRDDCVKDIRNIYKSRRDVLVNGLLKLGWEVELPKATMFVWAKIPQKFQNLSSVEFSMKMINEAECAVSPGSGFGKEGEGYIRFALIENELRTKQALKNIKQMMNK